MKMGPLKALGPDGYLSIFFKETREITGHALHQFPKSILDGGFIRKEVAEVLLVLIPQEECPSRKLMQCECEGYVKNNCE